MTTRRDFLKTTSAVVAAVCCGTGVMQLMGCVNYKYINADESAGKLVIRKSEFMQEKFIVVKSPKLNAPVYLSKQNENAFTALLMICTHKNCEVKPTGTILLCPCHGSEFSNTGKVLKEPADKDLFTFTTSSDEQNIYIHLK